MSGAAALHSVEAPLRVVMVWPGRALDPALLSGMPASMAGALERRGHRLLHVESAASSRVRPALPAPLRRCARSAVWALRDARERLAPRRTRERILARARLRAEDLACRLEGLEADVLFGCCISTSLAFLETSLPVVYFSDATPELINTTYPAYARRSRAYHLACGVLERCALERSAGAGYASSAALRSAVEHYGLAPDRAAEIPMGANILPDVPVVGPRCAPTGAVHLAFIGADPVRKRLDLCVRAAELLRERGRRATLRVIGPLTRAAARSPVVEPLGRLSLGLSSDRARARAMLADTHLLLLPSMGEAFGIAPCEAAHFGVPSIVSDAGGLPSVVRDGETGRVLPVAAGARDYADAIDAIAGDPGLYERWSRSALARARATLNWDAWAGGVEGLLRSAAGVAGRPGGAAEGRPGVVVAAAGLGGRARVGAR
ncbi:MAG: glycosyltransferase family 4 protein [Phycisphaerales bacterium]|nr:glycosyltransferase family 4 protein [Phycisphaerales bacterium]